VTFQHDLAALSPRHWSSFPSLGYCSHSPAARCIPATAAYILAGLRAPGGIAWSSVSLAIAALHDCIPLLVWHTSRSSLPSVSFHPYRCGPSSYFAVQHNDAKEIHTVIVVSDSDAPRLYLPPL
jgi:hypothetical protein